MTIGFWLALVLIVFGFVVFRGAPYVPSRRFALRRALSDTYPLGENDLLVDLGSGDGIVLREAARAGARAVGYELNPILVWLSRLLSRDKRIKVELKDYWNVDFPDDTTIVYAFSDSRDIAKMAAKVQTQANRLRKRLFFLSYGFQIPGARPVKAGDAYFLYRVEPLQPTEA